MQKEPSIEFSLAEDIHKSLNDFALNHLNAYRSHSQQMIDIEVNLNARIEELSQIAENMRIKMEGAEARNKTLEKCLKSLEKERSLDNQKIKEIKAESECVILEQKEIIAKLNAQVVSLIGTNIKLQANLLKSAECTKKMKSQLQEAEGKQEECKQKVDDARQKLDAIAGSLKLAREECQQGKDDSEGHQVLHHRDHTSRSFSTHAKTQSQPMDANSTNTASINNTTPYPEDSRHVAREISLHCQRGFWLASGFFVMVAFLVTAGRYIETDTHGTWLQDDIELDTCGLPLYSMADGLAVADLEQCI